MTGRRYSDDDIEKIFSSLTPIKQKARLYIRDRMGYFGEGFILTPEEAERLPLSFEGWKRDEWEKYVSFALRIENGFKDMNRSLERLRRDRSDLRRTIYEIHDFEKLEVLMNKLLDPFLSSEVWDTLGEPDSPLPTLARRNLSERNIRTEGFNIISPTLDSENHIDLGISGKGSLRERAEALREKARSELWFYLCYEVAIRKRISEQKLSVPEYESLMKKNREIVEEPVSMALRWEGVQDNRTTQIGEANLKDRDPQEYPFPSLMRLIEDYSVRVNDIDLNDGKSKEKITEIYKQI